MSWEEVDVGQVMRVTRWRASRKGKSKANLSFDFPGLGRSELFAQGPALVIPSRLPLWTLVLSYQENACEIESV